MEAKIMNAVRGSENGLSLEDIGDITGLSRPTVSKFVTGLEGQGKVKVKKWGTMKVVTINEVDEKKVPSEIVG